MISAVIITFNEEKNIERCISSLKHVVDEIVVMDSFSTDSTEAICQRLGVQFYQQTFKGYGQQKNDAHAKASYDYILSVDADEVLDEELQKSIVNLKQGEMNGVYEIKRWSLFCNRLIQHGSWTPEYKIRLFNKNDAHWNLREVHEELEITQGTAKHRINGKLLHYTSDTIHHRIETINKYSTLGAKVYFENGKRSNMLKMLVKPCFSFYSGFIFKGGFMDGYDGLLLATLHSYEVFLKYSKLYQLQRDAKH